MLIPRAKSLTWRGRGILGPAKRLLKTPVLQMAVKTMSAKITPITFPFHFPFPGVGGGGGAGLWVSVIVAGGCLRRVGICCRAFREWIAVILDVAQEEFQSPPEKVHFPQGSDCHQLPKHEFRGFHQVPSLGRPLARIDLGLQNRMTHVVLLVFLLSHQEPA